MSHDYIKPDSSNHKTTTCGAGITLRVCVCVHVMLRSLCGCVCVYMWCREHPSSPPQVWSKAIQSGTKAPWASKHVASHTSPERSRTFTLYPRNQCLPSLYAIYYRCNYNTFRSTWICTRPQCRLVCSSWPVLASGATFYMAPCSSASWTHGPSHTRVICVMRRDM